MKIKLMKIPAFTLLLALLFTGCQSAEDLPPAPPLDKRFHTSSPSRLYFNNIRSTSYKLTELPKQYINTYQLATWPDTTANPYLAATIIDNWLHDQAYIKVEWRSIAQQVSPPWQLHVQWNDQNDTLTLESDRWPDHYELVQDLYPLLAKNNASFQLLLSDRSSLTVLEDASVRRLFRTTWQDYSKLTDRDKK